MTIIFTKHLLERMLQRGINKDTVVDILKNPDKIIDSFGERKIAIRKIDKLWCVVFVKDNENFIVLTVYFE